jgi:cell fate regulator YaaT (PSP1 superfamily)
MSHDVLVRYGMISEVARFAIPADFVRKRGDRVVIRTHRGVELGTLLQDAAVQGVSSLNERDASNPEPSLQTVLRTATTEDEHTAAHLRNKCEEEFAAWRGRIEDWNLQLELIDLEWTLDKSKLILYVLNDRGPESTKLALQAAAAGYGVVEVQPVGPDGPIVQNGGGGCGSGHCGSGDSHGCCD